MESLNQTEENGARDWGALFELFLRDKQYLKGVTERTIQTYKDGWIAFKRYGKLDISEQGVKNFMIEMISAGLKPKGANNYARSINSFLTWLFENKHTDTHLKIPMHSVEKCVLRTYPDEEVTKILSFKPRYFGEKRTMAMLRLMIDTGIRAGEAFTLKRADVDLDNLLITISGKGKKERKIPISHKAKKALRRWLREHNHELVFCSRNGKKLQYPNARDSFVRILKKVGVKQSEGCFHTFRRFFAKTYNRNGGNLFYLQKMMGHTSLEMTRHYTEIDEEALSAQHKQSSPLTNLKKNKKKKKSLNKKKHGKPKQTGKASGGHPERDKQIHQLTSEDNDRHLGER